MLEGGVREGSGKSGGEIEVLVGEVLIRVGEGLAQAVRRSSSIGSSQRVMAGDYIIGLGYQKSGTRMSAGFYLKMFLQLRATRPYQSRELRHLKQRCP
ncbi:MAG: hypothetical protein HC806_02905 [Anaerolineae bacterium]|nr:hypothetical protein [Anaerolineae bacterium]